MTIRIKRTLNLAACVAAAAAVYAGPLDKAKVASDAKWVVHIDAEALRKTKVGTHLLDNVIQPKIDANEHIKAMNLSLNLKNISGITAYGPGFEKNGDGVLLLNTSADVKKDMDTLVGLAALGDQNVKMTHFEPYPLYSVNNDLFVAPTSNNLVLLAKSKEQIEEARRVLGGKKDNLAKANAFSELPPAPEGFFFVGAAEGFQSAEVPPQAQVLKETTGGRLVVGEKGENVFVNLVFRGKDAESTTKIQQVLQGLMALVSMTQKDKNPDLVQLANSTKIATESRNVTVDLQFPTVKAIEKIDEKEAEKSGK